MKETGKEGPAERRSRRPSAAESLSQQAQKVMLRLWLCHEAMVLQSAEAMALIRSYRRIGGRRDEEERDRDINSWHAWENSLSALFAWGWTKANASLHEEAI